MVWASEALGGYKEDGGTVVENSYRRPGRLNSHHLTGLFKGFEILLSTGQGRHFTEVEDMGGPVGDRPGIPEGTVEGEGSG